MHTPFYDFTMFLLIDTFLFARAGGWDTDILSSRDFGPASATIAGPLAADQGQKSLGCATERFYFAAFYLLAVLFPPQMGFSLPFCTLGLSGLCCRGVSGVLVCRVLHVFPLVTTSMAVDDRI